MGDIWAADDKVYYVQGDVVLKGRVKRRLETGEPDYLLQNQTQLKVCEMHHTREDAERVLAAAAAANGARGTVGR